jgi:hypothetical protein
MYPDPYILDSSKRTPWIILAPGKIFVMGRSIPDDAGDFYTPVLKWVSDYVRDYDGKTRVDLGFEYINTTSTKWIFIILKELSGMKSLQLNTTVNWYYETGDEDMNELGLILRSLLDCPIRLSELPEMTMKMYEKVNNG